MSELLQTDRAAKLIKGAKSSPVNFAFGHGRTPAESVLAVDKAKAGKALFDLCKKEAGSRKGAFGTVSCDGGIAVFTCERNDLPDFGKAVTAWFKANGVTLKGRLAEDPAEQDEEPEPEQKPQPKAEPARTAEASTPQGPDAGDEDDDDEDEQGPQGKVFDPAVIVPLIRKARDEGRPFAFGMADGAPILAVHKRLDPKRLARMVREQGVKRGAWGTVQLVDSKAVFVCEKPPITGMVKGLRRWLKEAGVSLKVEVHGPDGAFTDPEDVADDAAETAAEVGAWPPEPAVLAGYERIAKGWTVTRERVAADLGKLREAILADFADDPDIGRIAESVKRLDRVLDGMDARLSDAVATLVAAPDAATATQARARVLELVRGYEAFLNSEPLVQRLDDNPFVPVSVHKSMSNALDHLKRAFA